jgi:cytidine deaminase
MSIPDNVLQQLTEVARNASTLAYCPYSRYPVGAAVLTANDEIFSGCNVENASYGLTMCAERNAIFQAIAKGNRQLKALVVYTPTQKPTAPCGACRQVISEFGLDAFIVSVCEGPDIIKKKISDLLPEPFQPNNLS